MPLGMERSFLGGPESGGEVIAQNYIRPDPNMRRQSVFAATPIVRKDGLVRLSNKPPADEMFNAWAWSAGGLVSTGRDVAKFAAACKRRDIELARDIYMEQAPESGPLLIRGGSWGISAEVRIGTAEDWSIAVIANATNVRDGTAYQMTAWTVAAEIEEMLRESRQQ